MSSPHLSSASYLVTNVIAAGAIATPIVHPWLENISDGAALLAPILGSAWLATQIIQSWLKWYRRK